MALNFKCPTCVALVLTSTVNVQSVKKNVVISRGFFDQNGDVVPPVVKQQVTTLCSQGHEVVNEFNKIPDEIMQKLEFFLP